MHGGCIDSIVSTIINSVVNTLPKTISEWEKQRTVDPRKHFYSVRNESASNKIIELLILTRITCMNANVKLGSFVGTIKIKNKTNEHANI